MRHKDGHHCLAAVLADHEWKALYTAIHRRADLPARPPTVRQAVRWIAQLGGFLGRKGDGEPGITTIWRGWSRLADKFLQSCHLFSECRVAEHVPSNSKSLAAAPAIYWKEHAGVVGPWPPIM
jgi:hypothetical protein